MAGQHCEGSTFAGEDKLLHVRVVVVAHGDELAADSGHDGKVWFGWLGWFVAFLNKVHKIQCKAIIRMETFLLKESTPVADYGRDSLPLSLLDFSSIRFL